jgi:hypothetical protein
MSARKEFYFRQRVTDAELNSAFDDLEAMGRSLTADLGAFGVLANAVVSPHGPVADLTVDISGPGVLVDQQGQRIVFSALQNVSLAQDENGVATAVSAQGKERLVSVFAKFERGLSDPRVDGNSQSVFFRRDEGYKLFVAQGAEASAGAAVPPPLRADAILLADVTRAFGQTQILAANISTARRQDAIVASGSPHSVRRGRTLEALADLLAFYNAHASGLADRHPAAAVDYPGGVPWADGTTNPPTSVKGQLDKLLSDLAGGSGADKIGTSVSGAWADGSTLAATRLKEALEQTIAALAAAAGASRVGAAATSAAPNSLQAGSVKAQLDALLGLLNVHVAQSAGAHMSSAISYIGGPAWADGTANPATSVRVQLDKIVAELSASSGDEKIGSSVASKWADGSGVSAARVGAVLEEVVSTLGAATGAAHIGAAATAGNPNGLAAGTVKGQIDALLGLLDAHLAQQIGAHVAAAIMCGGGRVWRDGTANPATTVEVQLAKLIADLAADAGAARIGAAASGGLPAGSVRSQLDALDGSAARSGAANVFTAPQTVNGSAGDQSPALKTTSAPTARKLLWEIFSGIYAIRFYATPRALELTLNARWDGAQWARDSIDTRALRADLTNFGLRLQAEDSTSPAFGDAAFVGGFLLPIGATGPGISVDQTGNWYAPGFTEAYAGWQGQSPPSGNGCIGTGVTFRKVFPAAPSSITFTYLSGQNISGPVTATAVTPCGCGVIVNTSAVNVNASFFVRVLAA